MIFSLIIPTCNRPLALKECLERVLRQDLSGAEILVSDDGENEQSREMIESSFPQVRWVKGPRLGPANNRNSGGRLARGEWLLFIDDDCLPREDFIKNYRDAFAATPDGANIALEGATHCTDPNHSLLWEAPHHPKEGGPMISCNFAMRHDLFHQLGGFDERFTMSNFEDIEFSYRFTMQGGQIKFLPDAAVDHPPRPLRKWSKLGQQWEARVITTLDLGAKPWQVLYYLPRHVVLVILSRLRDKPWNGETRQAAVIFLGELSYFLWMLPGWLIKHLKGPRSAFWAAQTRSGKTARRWGL